MQDKLVHTHHFTDDDETNCNVVFRVKSKGALFPGTVILEGHTSKDLKLASPTWMLEALSPEATEASRAPEILAGLTTNTKWQKKNNYYHIKFVRTSLLLIANMKLRYTLQTAEHFHSTSQLS